MPNVIVDLQKEIDRVRKLLPRLKDRKLAQAQDLLREAETAMLSNQIGYMKEALAELLEFDEPDAKRI